jgi:hypothetical protein
MSYELFNSQPTIQGRAHGKNAAFSTASAEGVFRAEALKFQDPEDSANYLTSVAKTLALSVGSTWASVYELARDVKETGAWGDLRPKEGSPPSSFEEWWTTIFGEPIAAFIELEHRYELIKTHYPELLTELNYEDACRVVSRFEKRRDHFVAVGQEMLDLYGERMEPEKRQELEAKVEKGEKLTQQEVADAAGVTQQAVAKASCKAVQQNGDTTNPPPSTLALRRVEKLLQIDGMEERIQAGESLRKLAVEAGIEQPSLCLPRSPEKAAATLAMTSGGSRLWPKR